MRCLNCGEKVIAKDLEKCHSCGVNLSGLIRDLLPTGHLLDRNKYRIDYPLGRGGFGVTYRAIHTELDQKVAIKEFYPTACSLRDEITRELVIPSNYKGNFEKGLKRFLKEAKILNNIEHPNIIKIRDFFKENNTAYIVMNLIEGKTLSSLLKEQPKGCLTTAKVKEIISGLVEALSTLHSASIYHLDIKPDNILITEKGKLVLVDFGASKQGLGNESTRSFTMAYAPLELISSQPIGAYSDIYSLGIMLYQMLTGKLPPNVLARIHSDSWQPEDLEQPWQNLVESAVRIKPEERPTDLKYWWQKVGHNSSEIKLIDRRYKIVKKIGEGTFGKTFLAEDTKKINNLCIVKKLKCQKQEIEKFDLWIKLFEREAEQLLKLGNLHDCIPSLDAYFEEEGRFYLVQEYIKGIELSKQLIPGKKFSESATIELLISILEPLAFLHQNGIIHRDIKPSNLIRRQRDDKIVLIDFGAVKELSIQIIDENGTRQRGTIIGPPGYMPSEQAKGKAKMASDIYAVGMIGIQALTGLLPEQLPRSETDELIWRERAEVSPFLAAIIEKMVQNDCQHRYQNATKVLAALDLLPIEGRSQIDLQENKSAKSKLKLPKLGGTKLKLALLLLNFIGFVVTSFLFNNTEVKTNKQEAIISEAEKDALDTTTTDESKDSSSEDLITEKEPIATKNSARIPIFRPGEDKDRVIAVLGQPTLNQKGAFSNTRAISYMDFVPDRVNLGYLYDTRTGRVRQTGVSFDRQSVDITVMEETLINLLGGNAPEEYVKEALQEVYSGRIDMRAFRVGNYKVTIQKETRIDRIYIGVWEADFH